MTYVKPGDLGDVGGFFIQVDRAGPALFVDAAAVAPGAPQVTVGDTISFRLTQKLVVNDVGRAAVIEDLAVAARGRDVEALRQDLTAAADLASNPAAYESELMRLDATIAGPWEAASKGHVRARLKTAAVPSATTLWIRLPVPLFDTSKLAEGCSVQLRGVLWRFRTEAQASTYKVDELGSPCK